MSIIFAILIQGTRKVLCNELHFTYRESVRCGDMHRTGNQFQLPEIIKTIWAIYLQSHHLADAITRILRMQLGNNFARCATT